MAARAIPEVAMSVQRSLLKITVARLGAEVSAPQDPGARDRLAERIAGTGPFGKRQSSPRALQRNRRTLSLALSLAWRDNTGSTGVWHLRVEDAAARQRALHAPPAGRFKALAVSPLESGRLDPPDIVLIYATPGQMILLINGLQWTGYEPFAWSVVGESACADSWGRALATDKPSLSLPCYAERRYGGVPDDEMLMAMPPRYLPVAIEGLRALAKNGLRYPIPPYGIQSDVRAGMAVSYGAQTGR
jgi:hypothetical protein